MCAKIILVVCLVAFVNVASAGPASFIKKCRWDDSKCAKESAQAYTPYFAEGIPEYKMETLDPLRYDKIDASSNDLSLQLTDIVITGIKDCQVKKIQRNNPMTKLHTKGVCTLVLDGQYEIGGRLLFLPIEGKGKIHVVLKKIVISVESDIIEKIGKDGKKYWDLKSWSHSYELKDKADIDLEGLFQGNEVLGRATRDLLTSNSNEVIGEVAPPIVKAILSKVIKNIVRFFKHVPVEELSLD